MHDTLIYSKPIKIKRDVINIPNNIYIKQKYKEYDYIINNINEIVINNSNYDYTCDSKLYNIYDIKENFFNPDKHSPPNSWKSRLMERIEKQNKINLI